MRLETLAETLLHELPDAVIVADAEGMIRFWNPGAERIFGFPAVEALGRSLDIIIPERLRDRHRAGYAATIRTGTTRYGAGDLLSVPATRKDGGKLSIQFSIVLLKDADGRAEGIAAVLRDVTGDFEKRRALEREIAECRRAGRGAAITQEAAADHSGASLGCPEHWRRLHAPADPSARVGPVWLPRAE